MERSFTSDEGRPLEPRTGTFTGEVWGARILADEPHLKMDTIVFAPGARTYWHSHDNGQVLQIEEGRGVVRARGEPIQHVGPGDIIWTAPGEEHIHGAASDSMMIHRAVSLGETRWLEEAADEELGHG